MLELSPEDVQKLMKALDRPGNHDILYELFRGLSCLGFSESSDGGLVIQPKPESDWYSLGEFHA